MATNNELLKIMALDDTSNKKRNNEYLQILAEKALMGDYPTQDIEVGKWINGATIYRHFVAYKCTAAHTNAISIPHGISPVNIVNFFGFFDNGSCVPLNYYMSTNWRTATYVTKSDISFMNNGFATGTLMIWIDYTVDAGELSLMNNLIEGVDE